MEPAYIEAFRSLCELIHAPTRKKLDAGTAVDWARFPSIRAAIDCGGEHPTPERVGASMRDLLEQANAQLEGSNPPNGKRVSPLEVIHLHLIEGYSWEAIVAECMERGRATSERTLRSRQRDGLEAILEWAEVSQVNEPDAAADLPATRSRPSLYWLAATVLVLIAVVAGFQFGTSDPDHTHSPPIGQVIPLLQGTLELPAEYPDHWRLPEVDARYSRATVVEPSPGEYLLVGATIAGDVDGGSVIVADPVTHEILWQDRFRPTAEMLGIDDQATLIKEIESFRPEHLIYGQTTLNLGNRLVAVYVHRNSRCFVVEYDLWTGERTGTYHHIGRLETHLIADLDRDGKPELLLGGQDNTVDRPVIVAFSVGQIHGAASTVPGTKSEGACARVVLPPLRELERHWGIERLQVIDEVSHRWNPGLGTLSFSVGAHDTLPAYRVFLTSRLEPLPGGAISVGEGPALQWRSAGLDPSRADTYVHEIRMVGGLHCLGAPQRDPAMATSGGEIPRD